MSTFRNSPDDGILLVANSAERLAFLPPYDGFVLEQVDTHTIYIWDATTLSWVLSSGGGGGGGVTSFNTRTGPVTLTSGDVTTALTYTPENIANKGTSNGYASLDSGGKVPASQLPNSVMDYLGTWVASTNTPTLADGTGNAGDVYIASDAGTVNFGSGPITFASGDWVIYSGTVWQKSINSNAVASVFGRTGIVTAQSGDYSTTLVTEGTNLYYTQARFDTAFSGKSTTDLTEGSNLYYTLARFNTALASKSTSDLAEGSNLYFTNARAIAAPITGYVSGAGTVSATDSILQAIQKLNGNQAASVSGVSSVSNADGTLTISPTTGAVVASRAAITGDVAVNAASNTSTLATVNSNVGTFGSASHSAVFTVNAKGLITATTDVNILIAESQVTNLTSDLALKAPLASPTFTGIPAAPTASQANNSTQLATTAYVDTGLATKQASGNYITALTGDIIASGPGSVAATLATVNTNVGSFTYGSFTVNAKGLITAASSGAAPEVPLTFSTGLTRSVNTITVNTSQNISTLSNLTTNGFVKTTGGTGALSIDTNTYITGNQTITLTGDVSGSGTTAITTTLATVTIAKGGTGQTTKAAGFDALSPMSASGDVIYGGTSGTGTRLAKGSDGQVLTLASGLPSWASVGGNLTVDTFSGDNTTTAFTLSVSPGSTANTNVYISGVYQQKASYSLSTNTLTFGVAPPTGTSNIQVVSGSTLAIGTPADGTVTYQKFAATTEVDNGNSGTSKTISFQVSDAQKLTLTGNCTLTFTNTSAGGAYVLRLVQDGTGSRTVTWPAGTKWPGGTTPTLTTTAGAIDIISIYYDGTNYYGNAGLAFA